MKDRPSKPEDDAATMRSKRHAQAMDLARDRRQKALMAKRLCGSNPADSRREFSAAEMDAAVIELKKHGSISPNASLGLIRKIISVEDNEEAVEYFLEHHQGIQLLSPFLASSCAENQIEAVWCVTNIATSCSKHTNAVAALCPLLLQLIEIENHALQAQCCWAIGNIAADCVELRDVVRANGATIHIVRLLASNNLSTRETATWALCNLIRGPMPKLEEIFAHGVDEKVAATMKHCTEEAVLIETSWALSYLTAHEEEYILRLIQQPDFLSSLCQCLNRATNPHLMVPLLRVVGNIASCSNHISKFLLPYMAIMAPVLCTQMMHSEHRGIKKETAWVISNVTACGQQALDALVANNLIPFTISLLESAAFDVKQELVFVVSNLSRLGYINHFIEPTTIIRIIEIMKGKHSQSVLASMNFVENVMRTIPGGPQLIEAAGGVDALDMYSYGENEQLARKASALVDEFFGENYGIDDEDDS